MDRLNNISGARQLTARGRGAIWTAAAVLSLWPSSQLDLISYRRWGWPIKFGCNGALAALGMAALIALAIELAVWYWGRRPSNTSDA